MTTYTSPFTGQTISPSQVGYESLTISANTTLQWPINGNNSNVVANIIEVNATVSGLDLILPVAEEVSVGQAFIVRNVGANSFTVTDNSQNTIISIASGLAEYIYLIDNTTLNGTWSTVTFGAGVSAANASTLAGAGLYAINTTLNTATPVVTVASSYTLLPANRSNLYVWTGGVGSITLPQASVAGDNWFVVIKNDGTGILTISPVGTDTIDGNPSFQLQTTESVVIVCGGTEYYTYGYGRSSQFQFTQLVVSLTGGTYTLTNAQAANIIQEYQGTLTSNATVVIPPTVQLYSFKNNTTGSFTLTFTTGVTGGSTIVLPQGQTIIAISDGTNVYNAQTSTSSFINALTIGAGSALAPSLAFQGDLQTGLYLAALHEMAVTLNGLNVATFTPSGLLVPSGINGGAF